VLNARVQSAERNNGLKEAAAARLPYLRACFISISIKGDFGGHREPFSIKWIYLTLKFN